MNSTSVHLRSTEPLPCALRVLTYYRGIPPEEHMAFLAFYWLVRSAATSKYSFCCVFSFFFHFTLIFAPVLRVAEFPRGTRAARVPSGPQHCGSPGIASFSTCAQTMCTSRRTSRSPIRYAASRSSRRCALDCCSLFTAHLPFL